MLSTNTWQNEALSVPHDTLYIMQVDTVFIPEPKPELTLDDSLALFKEDLQNALAPTFSYCYSGIHDAINDYYSPSKGFSAEQRLEITETYINKALDSSFPIVFGFSADPRAMVYNNFTDCKALDLKDCRDESVLLTVECDSLEAFSFIYLK